MDTIPNSLYYQPVLKEMGRLLSWQDREPMSLTYGCFDRTYWGWKFTDFSGARFQEGVYALAHLYQHPFAGNPYHAQPRLLAWIAAGLGYWQQLQYADGSFDEAYPFEHSLAATAFTGFYVGEAVLTVKEALPAPLQAALRTTFARAGDWLCRNTETHGILSNHLAAAAAALQVIYQLCQDERYEQRSNYFLQRIFDHQSPEGWYEEYGGADPGYQTHGTFYLARIWHYTQAQTLLASLERSLTWLSYCLHPNGTLGGEYGSRNTEFYFPAGFEILAPVVPLAQRIAEFMRPSVQHHTAAGLAAMDAYNFLPLLNNYLFAGQALQVLPTSTLPLPHEQVGETFFEDAGLYIKSTSRYYALVGLAKGGVLKVYDRQTTRLVASDCGYWARLGAGKVASNQSLARQQEKWQFQAGRLTLQATFVLLNQRVQRPWQFILFRLFTLTWGRWQAAAYRLKNILVQVLVRRRKEIPLQLIRRIEFKENQINVWDRLECLQPLVIQSLQRDPKFASIHMGSARYYQEQELSLPTSEQDWATPLTQSQHTEIQYRIEL